MKKIGLLLLIILAMSFALSACGEVTLDEYTEVITGEPYKEAEMFELAQAHVQNMLDNELSAISDDFDDTMTEVMNMDMLQVSWDDMTSMLGEHVGNLSVAGEELDGFFVCAVVEEFELTGVQFTITYNKDREVAGLYMNYYELPAKPETSEFFTEEVVTIGTEFPLEGILTLPNDVENPPVVLLVHGSGAQDLNETIFENTPFKDIAHSLAEKGIATLRYDKRFYTYSKEGSELGSAVNLENEVLEDVDFALDLLRNDDRVDSSKIYVLGHSLGGGLTPVIAYKHEDIAGIISMAGSLRPLYEISYDQNKAIESTLDTGIYDEETEAIIREDMKQVEKDIITLRGDFSDIPDDEFLMGFYAGYQKSVQVYQGLNFINEIDLPILVLQGEADFQVSPDTDYSLWEDTIGERENATLILYPELNHLMMKTNGYTDYNDYAVKDEVSSDVITDISEFINN